MRTAPARDVRRARESAGALNTASQSDCTGRGQSMDKILRIETRMRMKVKAEQM
jgi:hypothetical protein